MGTRKNGAAKRLMLSLAVAAVLPGCVYDPYYPGYYDSASYASYAGTPAATDYYPYSYSSPYYYPYRYPYGYGYPRYVGPPISFNFGYYHYSGHGWGGHGGHGWGGHGWGGHGGGAHGWGGHGGH